MKLETDDDQLMALAAFRYCLGRQTYIVRSCIDWLRDVWPQLTANSRSVIERDLAEAIQQNRAGTAAIDLPAWAELLRWIRGATAKGEK